MSSAATTKSLALALGPSIFLLVWLLPPPAGLSPAGWITAGVAIWMALWWATEAIPIPVTALLPLPLFPVLNIAPLDGLAAAYAHPIVFLFMGGFLLGIAMQRWQLHRRIALGILRRVGVQPRQQIAGFMMATAFLSMWVSNTATSIMMLPIALSVLSYMEEDSAEADNYRVALLLAIAYSASLGGIATLIGTPPNALLAAYLKDSHGIEIGFGQWMLLGLPVAVSLLLFVWWWLCRRRFPTLDPRQTTATLKQTAEHLGRISTPEVRVALVFVLTAAAWIGRPLLASVIPGLSDTGIAMAAGLLLFILPAGRESQNLLDWEDAAALPWGVLLLFGGGLALASVVKNSGLAVWLAGTFTQLNALPAIAVVLLVVLMILFLTEVSSNTATTAAFLPLMGALAVAQGESPLLYAVPAAIAASCAFMMPVATPPNAVVFASGHLRIADMMRAGLMINLVASLVVTALVWLLLRVVFL